MSFTATGVRRRSGDSDRLQNIINADEQGFVQRMKPFNAESPGRGLVETGQSGGLQPTSLEDMFSTFGKAINGAIGYVQNEVEIAAGDVINFFRDSADDPFASYIKIVNPGVGAIIDIFNGGDFPGQILKLQGDETDTVTINNANSPGNTTSNIILPNTDPSMTLGIEQLTEFIFDPLKVINGFTGAWRLTSEDTISGGGTVTFPITPPILDRGSVGPSTETIDLSLTTGHVNKMTLIGDITIALNNPPSSGTQIEFELEFVQDATGGRTVTFPASVVDTITIDDTALSTSVVTLRTNDGGTTFRAVVGGSTGNLPDGNVINDHIEWNGTEWIAQSFFDFGTGTLPTIGDLRHENDTIATSIRNFNDDGDLQIKGSNATSTFDFTDSGEHPTAIQIRSQHAVDPDELLTLSVGSGVAAVGLIDFSNPILNFGTAGANRLQLDSSVNNVMTLETQAGGVTSVATFNVISTHVSDPDNVLALNIGAGVAGEALIDSSQPILNVGTAGSTRLRLDSSVNNILDLKTQAGGVTSVATLNVTSVHTADPDNTLTLNYGAGVGADALIDITGTNLLFGAAGSTRLELDSSVSNILRLRTTAGGVTSVANLEIVSVHTADADNTLDLAVGAGSAGQALIRTDTSMMDFSAGGATRLRLDTSLFTEFTIMTPTGTAVPAILTLHAEHTADPDNEGSITMQSGSAGNMLFFTDTSDMRFSVDSEVLLESLVLQRATADETHLIMQENVLGTGNCVFNFFNKPPVAGVGTIGELRYTSADSLGQNHIYAQLRGNTANTADGNEDGLLSMEVAINGGVTSVFFVSGISAGGEISFFNSGGSAQSPAYTPTNVTTDRSFDADTVGISEMADVLGTLITDLQAYGLIG